MENNLHQNPRLVFVSHTGEDTWVARQIAKGISSTGATTFLDEADIHVGEEFEESIRAALNAADEFMVLYTPWALGSQYVLLEIGAAWLRRIPLVVVLHGISAEDFLSRWKTPVALKERNIIKLNDIDKYFDQLASRVISENPPHA